MVLLWHFGKIVVKDEVLGFFGDFYESGCLERSLNATFVVLVPKKGRAEELKDLSAWLGVCTSC